MGVSPSWRKFRGQKSFFRWCTTIFPWRLFTVSRGRNSKGKSRFTLGIQGGRRGRLCCFRREISPAKAVFAFLAHIKKGAPGVTSVVTPSPVAHEKARRLPPCRAFLWLQAVSGGPTESVVWVILLTFLQLSPGEGLPAPLAALFFPSPAHGSHTRAIRTLTAFQIDFPPPRFPYSYFPVSRLSVPCEASSSGKGRG